MSRRMIHECDRCGKECQYETLYCTVDRQNGPAGSMEDVVKGVDLCFSCAHWHLRQLVEKMDHEDAAKWHKTASTRQKPARA